MGTTGGRTGTRGFDAEGAARYDARVRTGIPGYDALHDCTAALLRSELGGNSRLLIAGVGTGEEVVRLGPPNPGWRFVGVDPSPAMLTIARGRVAEAGMADRTDLVEGTVADLPADPPYDAATLLLVMHFLLDVGAKLGVLRDIAARLRPGAPLLLADLHGDPAGAPFALLLAAWRRRILDSGADPADVATSFGRIREDIAFVPEARIAALLAEAGFGLPLPFWRGLLFGGWLARRANGVG
ncbi:MAG: class I SAM-dependent methyltransferase [Chloroflexia bacterium]|nr:class I SAM-dependent methyltransferase [Chloroflexia bacterium]